MRIAILTTQCPFVLGGAELHARNLERALRDAGHQAEIVTMPFKWYPPETILDHMLAARSLDVSEFSGAPIDLAICLKFPAYLMQHPNKTFWILHQHRQSYDLWDSGHSDLFDHESGQIVRDAVRAADDLEFRRTERLFANSENVAKRLMKYNGVAAAPLYHPPPLAGRLRPGQYGDYLFYPSRLSRSKRQEFVLRSLALCSAKVRVIFAGAPDEPSYGLELERLASELGVDDRVEWRGFVRDETLVDLYADARGVLFTPVDEDLGYIALEAMLAKKPLLTLTDAGEPAALVRDQAEGLVVAPAHAAFAEAMSRIWRSTNDAREMGAAAFERYRAMDISWENVVEKLTGVAPKPSCSPSAEDSPSMPETVLDVRAHPPEPVAPLPAAAETDGNKDKAEELQAPVSTKAMQSIPAPDDLAKRYAVGDHLERHRDYYQVHWPRYQATLEALAELRIKPRRILELGASEPYVFSALLQEAYPEAELTVVQEDPAGARWRYRLEGRDSGKGIELSVFGLNIETTPLPFATGEFDVVVAMEVLEHLAIDPGFAFREARRVLREDGVLLVTTPNLVSLPALSRALRGASPYSFGVYVPWNGVYGRHNREYTPHEVESLGDYAGLSTVNLKTVDLYTQQSIPEDLAAYMMGKDYPLDLRGQNIIYVGRKDSVKLSSEPPPSLYTVDPSVFSGTIELGAMESSADALAVRITNASPVIWHALGPRRIRLTVDRVDQSGLIARDVRSFSLPHDMPPGEAVDVPIRVHRGEGLHGAWQEIGLYAEGIGPFRGAGRANVVRIFAEDVEPAPELGGADADEAA